jgi:Amt family ammonium transporter
MFQLTFAIITVALLSGAIADRVKYGSWLIFVGVWITLVYAPIAHWAFASQHGHGGWIVDRLGALDFAGGTVVEINSGAGALALAIVLGRREGFKHEPMRPHNMPLVLLGAGMLWFGWFGFNAGSALGASQLAATAMINTQIATAAAAMSWLVYEKLRQGKATTLGIASGAVAGAVAMFDLAVIDEGHRLESAMRMGADAGRLRARTERVRRGIVEHQERTHRLPEGQIGEQGENMKAVAHPMRLG